MVIERRTGDAIGLLILFEVTDVGGPGRVDVRVGYVLAESAWGCGLATELVAGLVAWARSEPAITSLSGGVAPDNAASARVLTKNGFAPIGVADGEQLYRLALDSSARR